jgi:phosphoserine aminotransferase
LPNPANEWFSVFITGQVLKKSLATFKDKVDGQQALAEKKAKLIYAALDAHPEAYQVIQVAISSISVLIL